VEEEYLRDIVLVVDGTLSQTEEQREDIRRIVVERIVPNLGLGDRVFCYQIMNHYNPQSRVFKLTQVPPRVSFNLVEEYYEKNINLSDCPDCWNEYLVDKWQEFEKVRTGWAREFEDNFINYDHRGINSSDYLGTIRETGRMLYDLNNHKKSRERRFGLRKEKKLIVVGDLFHEPPLQEPPQLDGNNSEADYFSKIEVEMVYTGEREGQNVPTREELESFWRRYFEDRGCGGNRFKFTRIDAFTYVENKAPR
jgi:hypothetical protein